MRNTIRLIIFAAIVAVITFTIAPPIPTSADDGVILDARQGAGRP